ncbi:hypothetical protein SAMN06265361_103417 [Laceyella tengchongensis]|uniref:Uncharacterized protein n=1 Tax=Laceyella tengchongensis TaxID=574699 RepID=A0AA45WP68_9BACL|nr:hypothetical protein [Laceyella tengchongensis]SMP20738.1 hypothetical protein SAMN06265361_103417 [Laceyella tengchongensis]
MSKGKILAVITTQPDKVAGGAPIFAADSLEELEKKAFLLEKILDAMVHEIDLDTKVIVKH